MYPYHHACFIQSRNSFRIKHHLIASGLKSMFLHWSWDGQNHSKALQCQYITPQSTVNPCFIKTLKYGIYNKIKIKQHSFLAVLSPLFKPMNFETNSPFQLVDFHTYSCKLFHTIIHHSFTYHLQILIVASKTQMLHLQLDC